MIERFKDLSKEKQLKVLEDEIKHSLERGRVHWMTVAENLWQIRERKLYPQRKFGQYIWQKWGVKERYALQLLRSLELLKEGKKCSTVHLLLESGNISARAAGALADVPPEQREEVIEEASEGGKPPTETAVKKAAAKRKPKPSKPERQKDRTGLEIPERALPIWNRRGEVREKTAALYEVRQWAKDMEGTEDPFWNVRGLHFRQLFTDITLVINQIRQADPDTVCSKCQGVDPSCDFCYGRGMISADLDKTVTPIEARKIRKQLSATNDSTEVISGAGR